VEVRVSEEGLDGSIYTGTLAQRAKGKPEVKGSWVVFDQLLEEGSESQLLREWTAMQDIRPKPPPTPAGFARLLEVGDAVELYFEDGWWEVEIENVQRLKPGENIPQHQHEHEGGDEAPAGEEGAVVHAAAAGGMDIAARAEIPADAAEGCTLLAQDAPRITGKAMGYVAEEGERGETGIAADGGLCVEPMVRRLEGPDSGGAGWGERVTTNTTVRGVIEQEAAQPEATRRETGDKRDVEGAAGEAVEAAAELKPSSPGTYLDGQAPIGLLVFQVRSVKYKAMHLVDASRLRPLWLWSAPEALWRYEIEAGHGCATASTYAGSDADRRGSEGSQEAVGQADPTATFRFARGIPRSHNDVGSRAGVGTIYDALDHL
jgi:hypothetical protein